MSEKEKDRLTNDIQASYDTNIGGHGEMCNGQLNQGSADKAVL